MARQGKALGRWLPQQGARVTLSDKRNAGELADDIMDFIMESNVRFALGGNPIELLDDADMLCVSGGVPLDLPIVQAAFQRNIPVVNDAILFMEACPAPIIGITGSAGKTTTTTLIGEMCKQAGLRTWVGGNIGNVLLDDLADMHSDDIVVMELSSFQLEISQISPTVAGLLNVTPNHLDRHGTLEAYAKAKSNIFAHQSADDLLIYNRDDLLASTLADEARGKVASYSTTSLVSDGACIAGNRLILTGDCSPTGTAKVICERNEVKLRGVHNLSNILAASAIAGAVGVPADAMRQVISNFNGVAHRLEIVAMINEVTWVNDSIATSPERVIAALKSFDEPIILLAGGRDKDLPWGEMARIAVERCKAVICFGEFGPQINRHIIGARRFAPNSELRSVNTVNSLDDAVNIAVRLATEGDIVLLSPGGTSYDAYQDYAERGQHFRILVEELKNSQSYRS